MATVSPPRARSRFIYHGSTWITLFAIGLCLLFIERPTLASNSADYVLGFQFIDPIGGSAETIDHSDFVSAQVPLFVTPSLQRSRDYRIIVSDQVNGIGQESRAIGSWCLYE